MLTVMALSFIYRKEIVKSIADERRKMRERRGGRKTG